MTPDKLADLKAELAYLNSTDARERGDAALEDPVLIAMIASRFPVPLCEVVAWTPVDRYTLDRTQDTLDNVKRASQKHADMAVEWAEMLLRGAIVAAEMHDENRLERIAQVEKALAAHK